MHFYSHSYTIPTHTRFGTLVELPLPTFSNQEWIVPNLSTLECYRLKVRADIRNNLKATLGSRHVHLKWTMPIDVYVDLFSTNTSINRMKDSFVCHLIKMEWMNDFLSLGWDEKVVSTCSNIAKCVIDQVPFCFAMSYVM